MGALCLGLESLWVAVGARKRFRLILAEPSVIILIVSDTLLFLFFSDQMEHFIFLPYRFLHRGKTSDFEQRLDTEAEKISWDSLKERIDFMYIAMHGRYAEDGTMQGLSGNTRYSLFRLKGYGKCPWHG